VGSSAAIGSLLAIVVIPVAVVAPASAATITGHAVINEIVADPVTGSQWGEIYYPAPSGGLRDATCQIRDDDGNSTGSCGHMVDDVMIQPIDPPFLDASGDTITLTGTSGELDTVTFPALAPGESYARSHDASTDWEIRSGDEVTRNASNGEAPPELDPGEITLTATVEGTVGDPYWDFQYVLTPHGGDPMYRWVDRDAPATTWGRPSAWSGLHARRGRPDRQVDE
jgi:hypothetical protein